MKLQTRIFVIFDDYRNIALFWFGDGDCVVMLMVMIMLS